MYVLVTLAVIIVMAITGTAPSTARRIRIRPVLIIIILVDYLIPMQWSNSQEVTWLVLLAAWRLNLCPAIIATKSTETLSGAFHTHQAGCPWIAAINLIPEGTAVVPPPIVHMVAGFVKHLPHICAEGSPPMQKRLSPAPAVWPHQLQLRKVASCDWIEQDFVMKQVPCSLILDASNIVYRDGSTDVFQVESLYIVPIHQQESIHNRCWHHFPSLPLSCVAALWCHCYELKMNLHPKG